MTVHHLKCGTMRPMGTRQICHVLLIEADDHLVLVDSGFGRAEAEDPSRLGWYRHIVRPDFRANETAIKQLVSLGYSPADVRHIVLTHADFDHVGGIADFPDATVHLSDAENAALRARPSWLERQRYLDHQWNHCPTIETHGRGSSTWRGFDGVSTLDHIFPGLRLVPLPGHTAGHVGVALPTSSGWLFHVGDAAHYRAIVGRRSVPAVRFQQYALAHNDRLMQRTQRAIARVAAQDDVTVINAHDPRLLPDDLDSTVKNLA